MDWEFWVPLIFNFAGLVLAYKQLRLMQPQAQHSATSWPTVKRYWPVMACFIFMMGSWLPYYAATTNNQAHVGTVAPTYQGRILTKWGTGPDRTCEASLNGQLLMKHKDDYGVVVACGFKNSTIDRLEDTEISVSSVFTIWPGAIEISIPLSQQMSKAFNDRVDHANKQAKDSGNKTAQLNASIWFEVILLPRTVNTLDIHKLADVARLGGQIPSLGIIKPFPLAPKDGQ